MHEKTTQIFKGATTYLASGIVSSAATFLLSLIVSRYLGKEGLGVFSVCFTVILVGVVLSELGLNPFIMREFAPTGTVPLLSFRSIIILRFAASATVAGCFVAVALLFASTSYSLPIFLGTSLLIVSRSVGSGLENLIKAKLRHMAYLFLTLASTIAQVLLVYVVLSFGFGIGEALLALAATDILKLLILMVLTNDELQKPASLEQLRPSRLKPLLAQCAPFMLVGLLTFLSERVDIFLLATFRSAAEAGLYSAADRFLVIGNLIDSSIFASTLPILSSMNNQQNHRYVTRQLLFAMMSVSIVVTIALFFAAPLLIKATFRFPESILLLQMLAISFPAMMINRVVRTALYSIHEERAVATVLAITCIGSIVLNVLFIPRYGAVAAAAVTIFAEYSALSMYGVLYLRTDGRNPTLFPGN